MLGHLDWGLAAAFVTESYGDMQRMDLFYSPSLFPFLLRVVISILDETVFILCLMK